MAAMRRAALYKFESVESFVFLDHRGGTGSSAIASPRYKEFSDVGSVADVPALTVAVSIRRGRVLLLTTVVLGFLLGLTYTFKVGVELKRFTNHSINDTALEKLLDDYNSYSGNIASAFGKPLEVFVGSLVQIIALRFMARAYVTPTTSWKLSLYTLVFSTGVGYLISNGFNALNVQVRTQEIRSVILVSDLSTASTLSGSVAARTSNVMHTVSELEPKNLVSNTVLRNAVLSRVPLKQEHCDWEQTQHTRSSTGEIPLPTVEYGFTQRDWQSRFLQEAPAATTLRIVVNATNSSANVGVKAENLPMNASTAADLFIYALSIAPRYLPWGDFNDFIVNQTDKLQRKTYSRIIGLLPQEPRAEVAEWEALLKEIPNHVKAQFTSATNTSRNDISVTFSHVDISPEIQFDAVTIEAEMDPTLLVTDSTKDNSTCSTRIFQAATAGDISNCGPWPALCFVKKNRYKPPTDAFRTFDRDPHQQVIAFGSCVDAQGSEELSSETTRWMFECNNASNTSMMVLSIGKRLAADAFEQVPDEPGVTPWACIKNLRKIYTFTIGRLSWKLQDLSETFKANCQGSLSSTGKCSGLHLPLADNPLSLDGAAPTSSALKQQLVVSVDALPTDVLLPSKRLDYFKPRSVSLVEVGEWPYEDITAGDILLPHNAGKVVWNDTIVKELCDADYESHIFTRLNNHMYIEHGLQPAYTAATFFLFQSAAVKDVIPNPQSKDTTMLNFDGNTQDVVVRASIPDQSAWLTLAGCLLLAVGLVATIVQTAHSSSYNKDPLVAISAPHTIARVMLDSQQFPPFLLHRRAVDDLDGRTLRKLEDYLISDVILENEKRGESLVARK